MSDITEIAEVIGKPAEVVDEVALAVQLGQILGRRQAYVELAGRCSAYDAASIKKLREAKLYLKLAPNWAEFCPKYLGMSKPSADRVIRWLDDFGPDFFTLTQLTRVSPDEYRERIAPAMADGAIRCCGETIRLIPENTEKVAAAVDELRQAAAPGDGGKMEAGERLRALERRIDGVVEEFKKLRKAGGNRQWLMALAQRAQDQMKQVEREV